MGSEDFGKQPKRKYIRCVCVRCGLEFFTTRPAPKDGICGRTACQGRAHDRGHQRMVESRAIPGAKLQRAKMKAAARLAMIKRDSHADQ